MLILVDSGSSHSFLSAKLASQLTGASELPHPMTMTVANGAPISCSVQFQETVGGAGIGILVRFQGSSSSVF
jgi:hypothetical protein